MVSVTGLLIFLGLLVAFGLMIWRMSQDRLTDHSRDASRFDAIFGRWQDRGPVDPGEADVPAGSEADPRL